MSDITKPEIIDVEASPSIQEVYGYVNITCTVTDNVNVNTVKVNITGPLGFTPINTTMTRIADTDNYYHNINYSILGTYYYYIWANDTSNNQNISDINTFTIRDTTKPEISDAKASPDTQEVYGYVNITCTVSDNVLVSNVYVNITYPNGTPFDNFSMTGINLDANRNGTYYYNMTCSVLGTYSYYIWANDTSGNANISTIHYFTIQDTTLPEISNVQAYPTVQAQNGWVNITCSVTDNFAVDLVTINISGPTGFTPINTTMTQIPDTNDYYYNSIYAIAGTYSYYIWTNDTSENENKSTKYYFIITLAGTEIIDDKEVNVFGIGNGTVNIESVALPQPPPENLQYITCIEVTITGELTYINITIEYSDEDVKGLNEATLRMYYWTGTEWKPCNNTGVDVENNIVWANVTELTIFAPLAEKLAVAPPVNWLLYLGILAAVIIIVLAVLAIARIRKKK